MHGSLPSSAGKTPPSSCISTGSRPIGWADTAFFIPSIVSEYKRTKLFGPLSKKAAVVIEGDGRTDAERLAAVPDELVPIIGCTYEIRHLIKDWLRTGRRFIYWDRGYVARGGKAWLPTPGLCHYRWQLNGYQMTAINPAATPKRWWKLRQPVQPWRMSGKHVVIAAPSAAYSRFHELDGWWLERTIEAVTATGRRVVVREKDSRLPLQKDLVGAHCLVTHGSVAAVEAVIMGCPVFVDHTSAAAPVGRTDLDLENPVMPDRTAWLNSLANAQFNLPELLTGECWRHVGQVHGTP